MEQLGHFVLELRSLVCGRLGGEAYPGAKEGAEKGGLAIRANYAGSEAP